ncbi:MAG: GIN domain-containing protein [bacterium]
MIKKLLFVFVLIGSITATYAQKKEKIKGSKIVTIQETQINSFNRIVVGEKFEITLTEGETPSVEIEADDNLHDVIKITVADSTLYFKTTRRITTKKELKIKVTYTNALKQIETKEDGEVSSLTSVNNDEMTLVHSGSSKAFLNIKSPKFKLINSDKAKLKLNVTTKLATLELNDNSKLEALINTDSMQVDLYQRASANVEGDLIDLNVRADNSSTFTGKNLTATTGNVQADLNSDVYVQATDKLIIKALGSSEVYIYAEPEIELLKFAGTAKLHKKELKSQ